MALNDNWREEEKSERSFRRGCLGATIFFLCGGVMELCIQWWWMGFFTILLGFVFGGIYIKNKDEYSDREGYRQDLMETFYNAQKEVEIPQNSNLVCEGKFYLWKENNSIKMFAATWESEFFKLRTIPISNIIFYSREGEMYTETNGYGGGSSYSMINGWNGKIDPTVITTELKDNRKTVLLYRENDKDYSLELGYADYLVLKKLIPEKDMIVVSNTKTEKQAEGLDDKLKILKDLYEQELISKEEFETKKEKLLQDF